MKIEVVKCPKNLIIYVCPKCGRVYWKKECVKSVCDCGQNLEVD